MHKTIIHHRFLAASIALAHLALTSPSPADEHAEDRAAIVGLVEDAHRLMSNGQEGEAMRRYVAPGATFFQRFGFLGGLPTSPEALEIASRRFQEERKKWVSRTSPMMIEVRFVTDEVALATYYVEVSFGRKGEILRHRLARVSNVLARKGEDSWKVVHGHLSDLEHKPDELQVSLGDAPMEESKEQ